MGISKNILRAKEIRCSHVIQPQTKKTIVGLSEYEWLRIDPLVLILGFAGWTVPSAIPVSGFGGDSLFLKFVKSIGSELTHFPTGPSFDSSFWLYLSLSHMGLFLCLLLGQIGVQGRRQVS